MTREQVGRLALRAYPETVRCANGDEILATLLDSSDGSNRAFVRELYDLVRAGLRSRSRATVDVGFARLAADGFCLAAMLWVAEKLSYWVQFASPARWQLWLLAASLALALAGYDRLAGLAGIVWIVLANPRAPFGGHVVTAGTPASTLLVAQNFALLVFLLVMVLVPRRRQRDLRRLTWLVPLAAVGAVASLGVSALIVVVVVTSLIGLAGLPTHPRLAIGAALWWTAAASPDVIRSLLVSPSGLVSPVLAMMLVGPVVIVFSAVRMRRLRHQAAA